MSVLETLRRQPRWLVLAGALVLVAVFGWIDYVTEWEFSFFIFYALPITIVVRKTDRRLGFVFAVLCAGVWCLAQFPSSPYHTAWGFALAGATRLFYFATLVVAVDAIKAQTAINLARIRALERTHELEREILRASEQEKRRIGQDLHDGLGPHLASIGYAAAFLANDLRDRGRPEAEKAEELYKMAGKALSLTRGLARGIFPVQMDATGLAVALEDLAGTTSHLAGIPISFFEAGNTRVRNPETAMHLFRIAQEAVNNAVKHSGAKSVTVSLSRSEKSLMLAVTDDGKGMEQCQSGVRRSLGLRSMQYRARALGAELKLQSKPNEGTIVSCEVPDTPTVHEPPAS